MRTSSYETIVHNILKRGNIYFEKEQSFIGLKGNRDYLRFDIVVYEKGHIKCLIEIQGEQHYKETRGWGTNFKRQKEYDRKKIAFALSNNIELICLPYWDINDKLTIEQIFNNPDYKAKSIWHNDDALARKGE